MKYKHLPHSVYILMLEHNKLYVGMTPDFRIEVRYDEHCSNNPKLGSRWTKKHRPIAKIWMKQNMSWDEAHKLEQEMVILMMKTFGLDSVRGGKWNMITENDTWWVPEGMKNIQRSIKYGETSHQRVLQECLPTQIVLTDI